MVADLLTNAKSHQHWIESSVSVLKTKGKGSHMETWRSKKGKVKWNRINIWVKINERDQINNFQAHENIFKREVK